MKYRVEHDESTYALVIPDYSAANKKHKMNSIEMSCKVQKMC